MIERVGYLLVAAEQKSLVSVGTHDEQREFCLVWFGKDGSIYVEPRLRAGPGIVSTAGYSPEGERLINLMEQGKTASRTVKLSHHPDGRVHFSKHGHIPPKVGRKTFQLSSGGGKVFDLKVFNPGRLDLLTREKRDRAHVRLRFSGSLPSAVVVSGHWVSTHGVMDIAECERVPCGPLVQVPVGNRGTVSCFLLRQPAGYPFRDHLLMLEVHRGEPGPNDDVSALLVGGHSPGESGTTEAGLIASLYPFNPQLAKGESMDSLDPPHSHQRLGAHSYGPTDSHLDEAYSIPYQRVVSGGILQFASSHPRSSKWQSYASSSRGAWLIATASSASLGGAEWLRYI